MADEHLLHFHLERFAEIVKITKKTKKNKKCLNSRKWAIVTDDCNPLLWKPICTYFNCVDKLIFNIIAGQTVDWIHLALTIDNVGISKSTLEYVSE